MSTRAYFTGRPGPRTRIDVGGSTWDIDTNGEAFVALRHPGSMLAREERNARVRTFTRYLELTRPADATATDVAALLVSLGAAEYPKDAPCPECGGDHRLPDADGDCQCINCVCDACDHRGMVQAWPDKRYAWVLDRPLDANLVAVSLDVAAAAGPCAIWIDSLDKSLVIDGADWRAVVMPMREPDEYTRDDWERAARIFSQPQAVTL